MGTIPSMAIGTSRDLMEPKSLALQFNLVPSTPADGEQRTESSGFESAGAFSTNSAQICPLLMAKEKSPRREVTPPSLHGGGPWVAPPQDICHYYGASESAEITESPLRVTVEDPGWWQSPSGGGS